MEAINTSSTFFQLFCKSLQEKIYVLCAHNLTHIVSLYINKIYHKNHWTIRRAQKRPRKMWKYNPAFMPHSLNFRAALLNEKVMIPWNTPWRHDTFQRKNYWIYITLLLSSYCPFLVIRYTIVSMLGAMHLRKGTHEYCGVCKAYCIYTSCQSCCCVWLQ